MSDRFNVVLLVFGAVAAVIAAGGLYSVVRGTVDLRRSQALRRDGQQTMGTVVDNQVESHFSGGTAGQPSRSWVTFRAAIRFRTLDGREITAIAPASSRKSFVASMTVPIVYDPADPTRIQIASGHGRGSGGLVRVVGGLLAIAAAAGFVFFMLAMNATFPGTG